MATLGQLEAALRAADAAGNADDAKRLAQAYAAARGSQQPAPQRQQEAPQGPPDSYGRQLGLGVRSALEGVASIPDFIGAPAYGAYRQSEGREPVTFGGLATAASDAMGLPKPATPTERVISDISRAGSGTAVTLGAGAALPTVSKIGQFLSAQPKLQMLSAGSGAASSGIARENGATPGMQTLAGLVGGLAPAGVVAGVSGGIRSLVRGGEAGRQAMENNVRDFASVGATPSVGQAAGNWRMQGVESMLSGAPTSNGVMTKFAKNEAEAIGTGLQSKADQFSANASAGRAGKAVERGAETFAGNVGATRNALYWQADKLIPPTTTLPLTRTQQALSQLTTPNPGAAATTGAMVNPKISALYQNISTDLANANMHGLPYNAVKDIRSRIGAELSDYSLSTDKPTAEYKKLYAALSQDMEDAARRQGPAAEQAMRRANSYYKLSGDRLDLLDRVVNKAGGPEKVYTAVMAGTKDGGTTVHAVMQSLPPDAQRAFTAAVIKRMGLATSGNQNAAGDVFSSQTFLSKWNDVSPEAKRALFDRHGPAFVASMDRIARVAENIKTGSQVFANPSGTANKTALYSYGAGLAGTAATGHFGAFGVLAAGGALTHVAAHVFTSPKVVGWLATTTTLPKGALAAQISALAKMAKTDPDAAELYEAVKGTAK